MSDHWPIVTLAEANDFMKSKTKKTAKRASGSLQPDCSALALDAQHAIKQDNVIGSYEPYAEWLASHERGYLYLKQAISALAWHLHKTGNLPMMWQAVDEVNGAARCLVDEKVKAQNIRGH